MYTCFSLIHYNFYTFVYASRDLNVSNSSMIVFVVTTSAKIIIMKSYLVLPALGYLHVPNSNKGSYNIHINIQYTP